MISVSVIGAGNMGSAIIKGIKGKYKLIASDADRNKLKSLGVKVVTDNRLAVKASDILILAVKPQNMSAVMNEIRGLVKPRQLVISIAAGVTTKKIEEILGNIPVIRIMPNMPSLIGMGISAICKGCHAKAKHLELAKNIFLGLGDVIYVKNEKLMNAVTAVSGSGPAYVYLFIESMIKAAIDLGLNRNIAGKLVSKTVKGSLLLLERTGKTAEELRKQVTSPGGTTEAALKIFEKKEFVKLVNYAIKAAHKRSKELSR